MKKYTKEQLIFYLRKLQSETGKTPTIKDMVKKKGYPSPTTYSKRFGTWNSALKAANLGLNLKIRYRKDELLENLRLLSKEITGQPKPKDLSGKKWLASYATYKKHFGTWKEALKQAGIQNKSSASLKRFVKRK